MCAQDSNCSIAQALRYIVKSVTSNNNKLDEIAAGNSSFQEEARLYFQRTDTVEKQVGEILESQSEMRRNALDALSTARAAESGYLSNQIVLWGLPSSNLEVARKVIVTMCRRIGVEVPPSAILEVRQRRHLPLRTSSESDPHGGILDVAADPDGLRRELFVTLKFAEL